MTKSEEPVSNMTRAFFLGRQADVDSARPR